MTGGNGYTLNRVAIDGTSDDYSKYPVDEEAVKEYRKVKILDLDVASSWYMPEFVGNTLLFASETGNMTDYNYIMACNLGKDGYIMSNALLEKYNEQFEDVSEKIYDYNEETNADGTKAYQYLSDALKYLYYTGDADYLDELIQAYVDIQGKDKEYMYSERSAEIYREFATATGDWAEYASMTKKVNGKTVYANSADYYYAVVGQMSEADEQALADSYKADYMQEYPVDDSTWWEGLSTVSKVFFIIGMVVAGLAVIAGITVLTIWLVRRSRKKKGVVKHTHTVDMTDDKSVDVYGNGSEE